MSNSLTRAAQKVRWLIDATGTRRDLRPSERLVLLALADDARDARGGRSALGTADIRGRTGCSERMVRYAFVHLQAGGHITREAAEPGAVAVTIVHPFGGLRGAAVDAPAAVAGVQPIAGEGCNPLHGGGATHCTPPIVYMIDRPKTHSPLASARGGDLSGLSDTGFQGPVPASAGNPSPVPVPVELPPVDQVFAAWDGWRDRAGLPGPVMRTASRRVAVDKAITDHGLGRVLMMVATIDREVRAGNFRRKQHAGQDTIWATFDAAFEVGHAAALNLLTRMLDGDFGPLVPMPGAAPVLVVADQGTRAESDEPAAIQRLRAVLHERLGARACAVWIDPLRFEQRGDELLAIAPSAFAADHVTTNYGPQLRSAARGPVRVMVKERV
jgi:hypothetical protein